ncbi:carbohydrate ABC transporter permease [Herbiconiux sp. L3-i23]|uniref:carbohydrate ABC transporter permease n=1 Tax=Herbiconiux sp. L3-i23 TaxID=2905871 RepID=UPI00206A70BD|nr:sugar ABC transporter permease [Herbiconiux sp. L3-i23]BDI23631.1 ABC transporter permease [Herbiconiux sp. L3-i23]
MSALSTTQRAPGRPANRSVSRFVDRHLKQIFILPSVIFVFGMIIFPLLYTVNLSLTDARRSTSRPNDYIGVENYLTLLTDTERFWPAVGRTFGFTLSALLIEAILGLAIALLLRKPFKGQGLVRVIILLPLVATPVAVGMMWKLMFEPTIGFANTFVGWFGIPAQGWLSDPSQTLGTLIFIDVWQWTPMIALICLAGLSTLPEEPDEAARVDGASTWQRFRFITLPLLMPTLISAITLRAIDALKTFDIIYATMGRGGGSSHEAETLNILAYSYSFDYTEYGLSAAVLVLFLVLICSVIAALVLLRNTRRVS